MSILLALDLLASGCHLIFPYSAHSDSPPPDRGGAGRDQGADHRGDLRPDRGADRRADREADLQGVQGADRGADLQGDQGADQREGGTTLPTCPTGTISPTWGRTAGGSGLDAAYAVAADQAGNLFVTGTFAGSVGPLSSTCAQLYTDAGQNAFLVSYDKSGVCRWAHGLAGPYEDQGYGVAVDGKSQSVHLVGVFGGGLRLPPSTTVNSVPAGVTNGFWATFQTGGTLSKIDVLGTTSTTAPLAAASARGVAVDQAGGVYLAGDFSGQLVYRGGAVLSPVHQGSRTAFVARFDDVSRKSTWSAMLDGPGDERGKIVAVHPASQSVYWGGLFTQQLTIGGQTISAKGEDDVFLAKLNAATGALVWVKSMGGPKFDTLESLAFDDAGAIYLAGSFQTSIDICGQTLAASSAPKNLFLAKLSPGGGCEWVRPLTGNTGTAGAVQTHSLSYAKGTVVLAGQYYDALGLGTCELPHSGGTGSWAYLSGFGAADGTPVFAALLASAQTIMPHGLCVSDGSLYTVGELWSSATFPGNPALTLTSAGHYDAFLVKHAWPLP